MDRWTLLTRAVALCSAGAAAIHFGVTQQHFGQWWPTGVFFLACAGWQAAWAVLVWNRPSNGLLLAGAVSNAAVALLWLLTRTVGLPFGPDAGDAEAVGVTDLACTALEASVIVLAGVLLLFRPDAAPPAFPRRTATVVTAGVAALVLLTSGVALAAPHGHDDGEEAHAQEHGEGAARHREPNLPDVSQASEADTEKAKKLLADTVAATKDYRDRAAAEKAGYDVAGALKRWGRKHPQADESTPIRALHAGNRETRKDGKVADASTPETLIFRRGDDGELALIGVMFVVGKQDGEPPDVAGPYTRWHTHKQGKSASMMHVWLVQEDELRQAYARKPPAKAIEEYQRTLP